MPLLAQFIGSLAGALANLFSRYMSFGLALKYASYTAWMVVLSAFLASVYVCMSSLYAMVSGLISGGGGDGGPGYMRWLFIGLGMFIPANAGAVIGCVGSVWISTSVYKIQRDGIHNYSK